MQRKAFVVQPSTQVTDNKAMCFIIPSLRALFLEIQFRYKSAIAPSIINHIISICAIQ